MAERLNVYDVKLSIRSKLHILQTIRSKLSWKQDRLDRFSNSVFGPWLKIQTKDHDNHLLNFLLQHQRPVDNPVVSQPFIFDISGRSYEFGREDFCLITGFRFGKVVLNPNEKDTSEFRQRVFGKTKNINCTMLLTLLENEEKFNSLDDEDAVRVCLLLALEHVFMGQEKKHMIPKTILNLVDDSYKWDSFPWGEYMWAEFHKKVYNVGPDHREDHLKKLSANPDYEASFMLYGFVFPLKVWCLETFSHSVHWWLKEPNLIPRGIGWRNSVKFEKSGYENLIYDETAAVTKLTPTTTEKNERWWRSSCEYFQRVSPSQTVPEPSTRCNSSATRGKSSSTKVQKNSSSKRGNSSVGKKELVVGDVDKDELIQTVKAQQEQIGDLTRRLLSVEELTKQIMPIPSDVDTKCRQPCAPADGITAGVLEHQSVGVVSPCKTVDDESNKLDESVGHSINEFSAKDISNGVDDRLVDEDSANVAADALNKLRASQENCDSQKKSPNIKDYKECNVQGNDSPTNS